MKRTNAVIRKAIPSALSLHIGDSLFPDTNGGKEASPAGRMVKAFNAGKLSPSHFPALRTEARELISRLEDGDEYEDHPPLAQELRELQYFVNWTLGR